MIFGFFKWLGPGGTAAFFIILGLGAWWGGTKLFIKIQAWQIEQCERRLGATKQELEDMRDALEAYAAEVEAMARRHREELESANARIAHLAASRRNERKAAEAYTATLQEELNELRKTEPADCPLSPRLFELWNKANRPGGNLPASEIHYPRGGAVAVPGTPSASRPEIVCRESSRGGRVVCEM